VSANTAATPGSFVERIAVVGAGVIGASWAAYFAARGCEVVVTDPAPGAHAALESMVAPQWAQLAAIGLAPGAARERIRFEPVLERAVAGAEFVQESGPERIEIKHRIFEQLDRWTAPDTLLVTSSSGLLVSAIQTVCRYPERVLLGHPFNPPHLMPLVEVVGGSRTSASAIARALAFYRAIGKLPIHLKREVPGHVANRLQAALWREAFALVDAGVASVEDIETAIESGPGLRWALLGPFANLALAGGGGGIRHVLEHLGPPMVDWWHDMVTPELTDSLNEAVIAATDAEIDKHGGRFALQRLRDERLIALLALKRGTLEVRR
jgi:3-hydroxyacyl-CoA dehydrogenase